MCSVGGCTSWRRNAQCFTLPEDAETKCQWIEFVAECNNQQREILVCSEHFSEESFEKSDGTNRIQLKPSAVPTVRIKKEESGFGDNPQKGSSQQMDQRHHSEISSPSNHDLNEDPEDITSDENPFPTETLVVVIKEESIKPESEESFSVQGKADISDKPLLDKHTDEETTSEESSEEDSDENPDKGSPGGVKQPKQRVYKYYQSVKQLCDDCGCFYSLKRAHTCEYKIKPYSCNTCGKRCRTKTSLKSHSRIHDNRKIHTCKYCYAPLGSKQDKISHEETHKDELSPFKCHSCPATFTHFLHRKKHVGTHPRSRRYKCEKCAMTFLKKHVLDRHMVVHTGEKAFKCSVCDRCFNQHGNLKSHMRQHTGEKPYKCQFCEKAFSHNVSLKSHVQRYHPNQRLPKTEDTCDGNGLVNSPDAADEENEVQAEVHKDRLAENKQSSAKSKRKGSKSLQIKLTRNIELERIV